MEERVWTIYRFHRAQLKVTQSMTASRRVALYFAAGFTLDAEFGMTVVSSLPAAVESLSYFISKHTKDVVSFITLSTEGMNIKWLILNDFRKGCIFPCRIT